MSSARLSGTNGQTRERTQLFANARPYSPSHSMRASPLPSSARESPAPQQFNDAVYDQLESQHDDQLGALSSKISILKDISTRIGSEVHDSTGLLAQLENRFDGARTTVRNTMHRMIRTADRSGVSWRSWILLFALVIFCFWFVMFI